MNLQLVSRTPSTVTLSWDHRITAFDYVYFIIEYTCDDWVTIQTATTTYHPIASCDTCNMITIGGLDLYPAIYQFRVRTRMLENVEEDYPTVVTTDGPNSEPLICKLLIYQPFQPDFIFSPGHLWFEVEQIATEGIFAFLNLVLYREWPKKVARRKNSDDRFIAIFQNGAQNWSIYIFFNE